MEIKTEAQQEVPKLNADTPIDAETLRKFEELEGAKAGIAEQFLALEQSRIRLLTAAGQVDTQRRRLYETVLVSRGIDPTTPVEVNGETGVIKVLKP